LGGGKGEVTSDEHNLAIEKVIDELLRGAKRERLALMWSWKSSKIESSPIAPEDGAKRGVHTPGRRWIGQSRMGAPGPSILSPLVNAHVAPPPHSADKAIRRRSLFSFLFFLSFHLGNAQQTWRPQEQPHQEISPQLLPQPSERLATLLRTCVSFASPRWRDSYFINLRSRSFLTTGGGVQSGAGAEGWDGCACKQQCKEEGQTGEQLQSSLRRSLRSQVVRYPFHPSHCSLERWWCVVLSGMYLQVARRRRRAKRSGGAFVSVCRFLACLHAFTSECAVPVADHRGCGWRPRAGSWVSISGYGSRKSERSERRHLQAINQRPRHTHPTPTPTKRSEPKRRLRRRKRETRRRLRRRGQRRQCPKTRTSWNSKENRNKR